MVPYQSSGGGGGSSNEQQQHYGGGRGAGRGGFIPRSDGSGHQGSAGRGRGSQPFRGNDRR